MKETSTKDLPKYIKVEKHWQAENIFFQGQKKLKIFLSY